MESFFRYISYVDYYKRGEKIKNVGFLRWKLNNAKHQIEFQIKNVDCPKGNYEIEEKNTRKVMGEIVIDKGIGNFIKEFPSLIASGEMYIDTFSDRLYLNDVKGFMIRLNSSDYLSVPVNLEQEKKKKELAGIDKKNRKDVLSSICEEKEDKGQMQVSKGNNIGEKDLINEKVIEEEERLICKKNPLEEQDVNTDKRTQIRDAKAASENVLIEGIEEKFVQSKYIEERKEQIVDKKIKIIEPIHEDKWQQLCKEYQNVHPFPDRKVFLSITPEDFIILQKGYQRLVHNSFLLHGFYNYGHMILGKLSEDEKAPIYIGVPGVYYEREKQAAQMFGFVGFESTEHPVQAGSYGYYMIEVEI